MNLKSIIGACLLGLGLGGCTTLGTNVNAKFRCDAPEGVCAPSMVIDDSALARIEETSSQDLLNPARPFRMDDGIDAPVHSPALGAEALIAQAAPSYELAVVFPGYTDATGTVHARRTVRTEAALPGRGDAMETMAMRGPKPARAQGLLAAAESAPPFLAIAPSVFTAPDPGTSGPEGAGAPAVAAAPSQAPGPRDPIAEIEAKVSEKLAAQQR
ncbi:MAG: hypothetical protein C0474_12090, partial [Sphingobium sp.]|nr:hypothetical protein [Sphingobium sp.]